MLQSVCLYDLFGFYLVNVHDVAFNVTILKLLYCPNSPMTVSFRLSTVPESCKTFLSEVDLLSTFIRSSLNEIEGPSHCWLNRSTVTKDLNGRDGVFLVVTGAFFEDFLGSGTDSTIMFEKVKSLQQRYPSLNVMGFQHCRAVSSDVVSSRLAKTIMSEYITFPILLSNKSLSEPFSYLYLFSFGPMPAAIKDLIVQQKEKPGLLHNLRGTWVKPLDAFREPYLCSPLQNLLLYLPGKVGPLAYVLVVQFAGCIEVDEVNNRLFLSDINHHRIIVFDGSGKILDCIGSSPGFEDGEFESSKIMRPAASVYDAAENCLYFVDSENHAIRRADMESRTVETFYPKLNDDRTKSSPWSWIIDKLWSTKAPSNSAEVDPKLLFYPWHLLKSLENDLLILNRSFETLWIMDLSSGLIKEVVKGSAKIVEISGPLILKKSSLLTDIPANKLPQHIATNFSVNGISHAGLLSSVVTFQDNIVISDADGQVVWRYNKTSESMTSFEFSKFGILGLPYWLVSPMESAYATLLPGRINIQMTIEIPQDTELVEPLDEGCIWRQTRGTATEVLTGENKAESTEKVIINAALYLRIKNGSDESKQQQVGRLVDALNPSGNSKAQTDACAQIVSRSEKNPEDLIFVRPLHVRLKINSLDHPKADNSKDIILTESSIQVHVSPK
ncbi:Six-bladed beta-propeller, TolB-like protein [Cynara cardunculus var. scolymus]|uniref:Six-bladed beta-propeller, TolB-like protein n=1 Tax=Cynara cardunculus var. scolymus TaxID=59895 RepID=A0A103YND4_CYNCS|nr:Six-bladed beta-propeller, TolB-like protein [Cynara cardunculus var. scolymus]